MTRFVIWTGFVSVVFLVGFFTYVGVDRLGDVTDGVASKEQISDNDEAFEVMRGDSETQKKLATNFDTNESSLVVAKGQMPVELKSTYSDLQLMQARVKENAENLNKLSATKLQALVPEDQLDAEVEEVLAKMDENEQFSASGSAARFQALWIESRQNYQLSEEHSDTLKQVSVEMLEVERRMRELSQ